MSSKNQGSNTARRPARPLWVPSVEEWAAMSWHQRREFVQVRRVSEKVVVQPVVEKVRVLIPCEKIHAEDMPEVEPVALWDEVRMHHEMVLMRRRQAARLAAAAVSPAEGDRNWNELAEAIGCKSGVRHVG